MDDELDDDREGFLALPQGTWDGLLAVLDRENAAEWLMNISTEGNY